MAKKDFITQWDDCLPNSTSSTCGRFEIYLEDDSLKTDPKYSVYDNQSSDIWRSVRSLKAAKALVDRLYFPKIVR